MCGTVVILRNTHACFSWFLAYKSLLFILGKHTVNHRKIFLNYLFIKEEKNVKVNPILVNCLLKGNYKSDYLISKANLVQILVKAS